MKMTVAQVRLPRPGALTVSPALTSLLQREDLTWPKRFLEGGVVRVRVPDEQPAAPLTPAGETA
jgi:hypothetical protein